MKIYVAGPMRGLPEFNFPAFVKATKKLRADGHAVFNPAERDLENGFDPNGLKGTDDELAQLQFCLRSALGADTEWICKEADAIYLLKGWHKSTGAIAERALGEALGLEIHEEVNGRFHRQYDKLRDFIVSMMKIVGLKV